MRPPNKFNRSPRNRRNKRREKFAELSSADRHLFVDVARETLKNIQIEYVERLKQQYADEEASRRASKRPPD